jgi:hypothetical protein
MPVRRAHDFQLNGKGYMLARGEYAGRAWSRVGRSDAPGVRSQTDAKWGVLDDELDHPEAWDDWSGGYGYPYREPGAPTYHWAENFDARWPRQLVHAQQPRLFASTANVTRLGARLIHIYGEPEASLNHGCHGMIDGWAPGTPNYQPYAMPPHLRTLYMMGHGWWADVAPLDPTVSNYDFEIRSSWVGSSGGLYAGLPTADYGPRAVVTASFILVPVLSGTYWIARQRSAIMNVDYEQGTAFAVAGNQVWRATGPTGQGAARATVLRNCDSRALPWATVNWGATYNIGDGELPIQDLAALEDQIYASTARGLYAGDSTGTFVNVLGDLYSQVHPENGRDIAIFEGGVVYPHISGLWYYQPGNEGYRSVVEHITRQVQTGRSPLQGRFRCTKAFSGWLYGGLYTGSQSWLMAGRRGTAGWVWHPLQRLPHRTKISRLHVDGAIFASNGRPLPSRIWATTDASIDTGGTAPIYWIQTPPADTNPLADAGGFTPNYCGSARMDFGASDWGAPGTPKIYRSVEVRADNLAAGVRWCKVYYSIDGEATRHLLGSTSQSPLDILYFPAGEGSFVTGQSIALSLESFTASPAITPIYRSIVLRGALQARSVDLITAVVRIADNIADRQGHPMRSGATMLRELRDLGNPDKTPQAVQMVDLAGATAWVKVLARVDEQETYQRGDEEPEIAASVKLAVLSFTGGAS